MMSSLKSKFMEHLSLVLDCNLVLDEWDENEKYQLSVVVKYLRRVNTYFLTIKTTVVPSAAQDLGDQ